MNDDLLVRMERLELRLMDLEHTLEVLNRTFLALQQRQDAHDRSLKQLEDLLRQLSSTLPARDVPEPPPPHY